MLHLSSGSWISSSRWGSGLGQSVRMTILKWHILGQFTIGVPAPERPVQLAINDRRFRELGAVLGTQVKAQAVGDSGTGAESPIGIVLQHQAGEESSGVRC